MPPGEIPVCTYILKSSINVLSLWYQRTECATDLMTEPVDLIMLIVLKKDVLRVNEKQRSWGGWDNGGGDDHSNSH